MTDSDLSDDLFLILPDGSDETPERATLSFRRSPTVLLTFASNRFTRAAARDYQDRFGLGAMDWRMLVMLTREPGSTVSHAARTIGIDKAAVSRSLHRLQQRQLATATAEGRDSRRKSWQLTDSGRALHDRILAHALERQKRLLSGFSETELRALTGYLARLLENIDGAFDDGPAGAGDQ
ncbi:MarR family winged helix-turn-helix transcriptional regulator [Pseudodonghicola flavimaris]|uniref:MarR family winged helix-turn-helix transcriptional regulator n=1 Tax=Pseudodonghicola flavimaris TaxID=3050036 RepID=A0ABT7EYE3_9RHOB|nr:MarR family winged helix-turn-helix transcriptional regulator [Pseudodonghicola flavimaris]MDK3017366.1 MarR family winged helix-turn-helix transcriptional regulator [Pseudodonghicola flavimaris]